MTTTTTTTPRPVSAPARGAAADRPIPVSGPVRTSAPTEDLHGRPVVPELVRVIGLANGDQLHAYRVTCEHRADAFRVIGMWYPGETGHRTWQADRRRPLRFTVNGGHLLSVIELLDRYYFQPELHDVVLDLVEDLS